MASHKDHNNLKRGQFFTSSTKMQEAMSWMVGARLQKPTIKQIRSAYEGLARVGEVGVTKVVGGMIVTILNYDYYQNPKNYEGRNEGNNEGATKSNSGANHNNKKGNKNGKTIYFSSDSDEVRLSNLLFSLIKKRDPKHRAPNIQSWAKHVDGLIRIDGRPPIEIEKVIQWCQADSFWQSNILSTAKLRKQFSSLWQKMEASKGKGAQYEPDGNNGQPWSNQESNRWLSQSENHDNWNQDKWSDYDCCAEPSQEKEEAATDPSLFLGNKQ